MLTGLQPGDLMLIIKSIYVRKQTGKFMRYARGGMLVQHCMSYYSLTFWYPLGAAVLLGRAHA